MARSPAKRTRFQQEELDWNDHQDYMTVKRRKLQDQLDSLGGQRSMIFDGVIIYVNGYTHPNADELKEMILHHGGSYEYALSSAVTHVIATNLPTAKIKNLTDSVRVCNPKWITDSIEAGKRLPVDTYLLYETSRGQKQLEFKQIKKSSDSSIETSSSTQCIVTHNKDFVSEFYTYSRLHHLSTWGTELKEFTNQILQITNQIIPILTSDDSLRGKGTRGIVHVDLDCFFVSVSILDKPHLKGKPVAVTHAKSGSQVESTSDPDRTLQSPIKNLKNSMSDIASCSYEAREYGIRNGMSVGQAIRKCPELILVPYEFDKYRKVSRVLYEILVSYSHIVQAVSCDEAYIELTDYARDFKGVSDIIQRLRHDVESKTGCTVSAGISHNLLLARMATRQAKPNGQFVLSMDEAEEYLGYQPVSTLPGVGWSLSRKLQNMGITTCHQLQDVLLTKLKCDFGVKTGEMLYYFSRGIDHRQLQLNTERKSISVDVNFGIRFNHISEAEELLMQLAQELQKRAEEAQVEGRCVSLKMKVRKASAPHETLKYLGHGACDNISRSSQLLIQTCKAEDVCKIACQLLKELSPFASDIRGMGLQLTKLIHTRNTSHSSIDIRSMLTSTRSDAISPDPCFEREDDCSDNVIAPLDQSLNLDLPPASELDESVLLALPPEIQEKIFDKYSKMSNLEQYPSDHSRPSNRSLSINIPCKARDQYIKQLRDNIKFWVANCPNGPHSSDHDSFCEFLSQLCKDNLEIAELALKCLRRVVAKQSRKEWIDVFNMLLSSVQSVLRQQCVGKLTIADISIVS